mmetsp:Transcript_25668/g.65188  ORF Transcript_25668/g.65188 Transcript_25668/m.65188 type:complete len:683 (-) Transcript_25668:132-2180(-)
MHEVLRCISFWPAPPVRQASCWNCVTPPSITPTSQPRQAPHLPAIIPARAAPPGRASAWCQPAAAASRVLVRAARGGARHERQVGGVQRGRGGAALAAQVHRLAVARGHARQRDARLHAGHHGGRHGGGRLGARPGVTRARRAAARPVAAPRAAPARAAVDAHAPGARTRRGRALEARGQALRVVAHLGHPVVRDLHRDGRRVLVAGHVLDPRLAVDLQVAVRGRAVRPRVLRAQLQLDARCLAQPHRVHRRALGGHDGRGVVAIGEAHHLEQPVVVRRLLQPPRRALARRLPLGGGRRAPQVAAARVRLQVEHHQRLDARRDGQLLQAVAARHLHPQLDLGAQRLGAAEPARGAGEEGVPELVGQPPARQRRVRLAQAVEAVRRLGVQPHAEVVPEQALRGHGRVTAARRGSLPDGCGHRLAGALLRLRAVLGVMVRGHQLQRVRQRLVQLPARQADAHAPAVQVVDARGGDPHERGVHAAVALDPALEEGVAPAKGARQVVARAQRHDGHRGWWAQAQRLDAAHDPGDGAVTARHQHAQTLAVHARRAVAARLRLLEVVPELGQHLVGPVLAQVVHLRAPHRARQRQRQRGPRAPARLCVDEHEQRGVGWRVHPLLQPAQVLAADAVRRGQRVILGVNCICVTGPRRCLHLCWSLLRSHRVDLCCQLRYVKIPTKSQAAG